MQRYIDDPVVRSFVRDLPDRLSKSKTAMVCMLVHAALHNDERTAYQLLDAVRKIE